MLNKDPKKRPSIKRILEKEFLAERISNLIPMSIAKHELGETFVTNHVNKGLKDSNNTNINIATYDNITSRDSSRTELTSKRGLSRDNS